VKRVVVVGTSGSGKSTLAGELASILAVPHVELDSLFHQSGWTPAEPAALAAQVGALTDAPGWIVDGNCGQVHDLIVGKADCLVFLDYRRPVVMWRVVRRSVTRAVRRTVLWNGNQERLRNLFAWDPDKSMIRWAWTTHGKRASAIQERIEAGRYSHMMIIHLSEPRATRRWLDQMRFDASGAIPS
jgi:adenylate kinase family enzyme